MRGSGTSSNPYIVENDTDLKALGTNSSTYGSKYIELGADITCSGNQTPISFSGHFDGKNHTITGLNISSSSQNTGLFGYCSGSFSIKNLKLVNGNVTSSENNVVGMLIGRVNGVNGAVVENIETDGCKVSGWSQVGGIVGWGANDCNGSMTYRNCYVHDGYVMGSYAYIGGIVGIGSCPSGPYDTTTKAILYDNCRVENEYIRSLNNNDGYAVAGIVGSGGENSTNVTYSGCEVRNCVVMADNTVGGIAGRGAFYATTNYTNCSVYNTTVYGSENMTAYVGGICAWSYGSNSSKTATVNITNPIVDGCTIASGAGGAIGGVYGGSQNSSYSTITIQKPTVRNCSINGYSAIGGIVGMG